MDQLNFVVSLGQRDKSHRRQGFLEETLGDGFIHRALSKEDVLSEPFLLDNSLRIVSFLSSSGPEISMDLLSSIEEAFRIG
jgi:hypothetical protein